MEKQHSVSASRLSRLGKLGQLAGGIAGGMLSEGVRQWRSGRAPQLADLALTPANAHRLSQRLAEMRGAAMKIGQLLSMDSGQLLPPELGEIMAQLRQDARPMPLTQVAAVLQASWGKDWQHRFRRFSFTPLAAASIGQVHQAELLDGRRLAIKVQYPGIPRSIDSDVDNVSSLLRLFRLLPAGMDLQPLLAEAKRQLHDEADYRKEAELLQRFAARLGGDPRYQVPVLLETLTSQHTLAMEFLDGQPIESLASAAPQLRDRVATDLMQLALREVFDWGLVQTDPNFANYLYQPDNGRIQLLDFGATRDYPVQRRDALRQMLAACQDGDDRFMAEAAMALGYLGPQDPPGYRQQVLKLLHTVSEPLRASGHYAFGDADLTRRMRDLLVDMRLRNQHGRLPPPDLLFLHRKLGGLYLLLTRLRARVPVARLAAACRQNGAAGQQPQRYSGRTGACIQESSLRQSTVPSST
jgi:predicted unusual protein kinase regulating ubiquinone biosynthesis (AarF/ABC1/UbiB family)